MSLISSFDVISIVIPDPKMFFWIAASVPDTVGIEPNCIKTLLTNVYRAPFIKGRPVFSNTPKTLLVNPSDCPILCKWAFYKFVLVDELLSKAFRSLETCAMVNNNVLENYIHC